MGFPQKNFYMKMLISLKQVKKSIIGIRNSESSDWGDEDYCFYDGDEDTVMMIRMITVEAIMRLEMMTILLLLWIFFLCANFKSEHDCWCHLVLFGMLWDWSCWTQTVSWNFPLSFWHKCSLPTLGPTPFSICIHLLFRSMIPISPHPHAWHLEYQHV